MGNRLTRSNREPARSFDLFADALWEYYRRGRARLDAEREDGWCAREDVSWYFTQYRDYPSYEKHALRYARGRVLDVGCGAGRHCLYLQRRGLAVTGIDISPRVIELARTRGVKDARVADIGQVLPFCDGEFDTVILLGNNLGICGSIVRFRKMLRELARVTTASARIIGTTRLPSAVRTTDGRYTRITPGEATWVQVRLRLRDRARVGGWFDLLLLSPAELQRLAEEEGWELEYLFGEKLEEGYAAVLRKQVGRNGPT